ncbi:Hsp33 family molecular chaperone HslO [Rickettsiales endosymbiont of Stachyamoeba lipophora]|uniref:Hsp33 family molecular chaperone HslO n=1 Tax=Rickettsiales endosymbiont of Stachyamoeba lipophora TaxID=2486578 RepID=UPI000F6514A5|nr:Hsp33 family molecular chaperone HslO [Rickettsiales endosymbiont of Stachyamoeba lipophora]AZL15252.1 Hsp33 family molecular chaperone HslO [Rickettsiales endosymbiont of Stachyamoeba lipophora]
MVDELDYLRPFLVGSSNIRGKIVKAGKNLSEIIDKHRYPQAISNILFEALMIASMFGSDLKKDGIITIQMVSNKIIKHLVVDATDKLDLRGYVSFDPQELAEAQNPNFEDLLGQGNITITIDLGEGYDRYQGIAEITGSGVAEIFMNYISNSEQLPTIIKIAISDDGDYRGGALMVQYIPGNSSILATNEDWREVEMFTNTITQEELLEENIDGKGLLKKLYNEHDVMVFDKKPLGNKCRCSHLRALKVIKSLPQEEIDSLKIDGKISVKCEFCKKEMILEDI